MEEDKVNGVLIENNSDTNSIATSGSRSERHEEELSDTSIEEAAMCGTCHTPITVKYGDTFFKCSDCVDMFICRNCHFRHKHDIHRDGVQTYHWLPDPDELPCDGCGMPFVIGIKKREQCTVWQCSECEDYALCGPCIEYGGLHKRHIDKFEEKRLTEYKDSL